MQTIREPTLANYAASKGLFDHPVDPRIYGAYRTSSTKLVFKTGLFLPEIKDTDTDDQFRALFSAENIKLKKISYSKHSSKNRIFDFQTEEDTIRANELLVKQGYKVQPKRGPPEDKSNLFIEGLPGNITNEDLKKFVMDTCPEFPANSIRSVRVEPNGTGFVRFDAVEHADQAESLLNEKSFPNHPESKLMVKKANNKNNCPFNGYNFKKYNPAAAAALQNGAQHANATLVPLQRYPTAAAAHAHQFPGHMQPASVFFQFPSHYSHGPSHADMTPAANQYANCNYIYAHPAAAPGQYVQPVYGSYQQPAPQHQMMNHHNLMPAVNQFAAQMNYHLNQTKPQQAPMMSNGHHLQATMQQHQQQQQYTAFHNGYLVPASLMNNLAQKMESVHLNQQQQQQQQMPMNGHAQVRSMQGMEYPAS